MRSERNCGKYTDCLMIFMYTFVHIALHFAYNSLCSIDMFSVLCRHVSVYVTIALTASNDTLLNNFDLCFDVTTARTY